MTFLSPARHSRLNEVVGFLLFLLGLGIALSLASFSPSDPSWDTASHVVRTQNLTGRLGAFTADLLLQFFGLGAYLLPLLLWLLGWKWVRSSPVRNPGVRVLGALALWLSISSAFGLIPSFRPIPGGIAASGIAGRLVADFLVSIMNPIGAAILTAGWGILALYLLTTFQISMLARWLAGPKAWWHSLAGRFSDWRAARHDRAVERAREKAAARTARRQSQPEPDASVDSLRPRRQSANPFLPDEDGAAPMPEDPALEDDDLPPFDMDPPEPVTTRGQPREAFEADIPIRPLEYQPPARIASTPMPAAAAAEMPPFDTPAAPAKRKRIYRLPSTDLLNEVPPRAGYDGSELKEIAARIKSKFEEFNVLGSVTQINPGPVVTTFEFKPEAGIKYSRITTLTEDLCLGLQAESILIERIPGKPTVGIEVPNTQREVISLRADSGIGASSASRSSRLTICAGQGHQRAHQSGGARIHAAPADRRLHRIGQERDDQFDDHVDPLQGDAG